MGDMKNAYIILVGKSEGKKPLGKPRSRWEEKMCGRVWTAYIRLR
jgi:hypothetical protein